jgi:hypothetical protein
MAIRKPRAFVNKAEEVQETETDQENRGAGKEKPQAREFSMADPAERLGRLLIGDHYPELAHQAIKYVFTSNASVIDKKPVIIKPSKMAGVAAWLANGAAAGEADPFFLIIISQTHWDSMPQKGREAFLDGALAQCTTSKKGALRMKKPDIQETTAVLQRHGAYTDQLKQQFKALEKMRLQPSLEVEPGGG